VSTWSAIRRRPTLLDAGTVVAIFALALVFARPLLEEWGLALFFRVHGVHSYVDLAKAFPLRPLQIFPSAFQSALFGDSTLAFAATFGLLLVAKYVALRWAVAPFLPVRAAWLAACLGTVLIPWDAAWRGRYGPAQLSAVFLFIALGAILRGRGRPQPIWIAVAALAIGLMLATYQALAVCAAVLPAVVLIGLPPAPVPRGGAARAWIRRLAVAWLPIALGGALYAIYGLFAVHAAGTAGYEGVIVDSTTSRLSAAGAWHSLPDLYRTAYNRAPWALPLFAGILALIAGGPVASLTRRRARAAWTLGFGAAILLLPLMSLSYIASVSYLADPDRVGFPPAVGFVLVVVTALLRFGDGARFPLPPPLERQMALAIPVVVIGLLLWTLPLAKENRRDYQAEDFVLSATARAVRDAHASSVVVQDQTGTLGDIYTLYQSTFWSALALRHTVLRAATLCTPTGVDRIAPAAEALGVSSTPRCEAVPPAKPKPLVLQVVAVPGGLAMQPG
jgi:hypothetical protein